MWYFYSRFPSSSGWGVAAVQQSAAYLWMVTSRVARCMRFLVQVRDLWSSIPGTKTPLASYNYMRDFDIQGKIEMIFHHGNILWNKPHSHRPSNRDGVSRVILNTRTSLTLPPTAAHAEVGYLRKSPKILCLPPPALRRQNKISVLHVF